MLKGLTLTPPVIGRISIGKVIEKNGKRLPEKDDQFTITTQVQGKDGWLPHPYDEGLRKAQGGKIRTIPVRLLFNDPDLNFRAEYSLFDRTTGRPVCAGNGEACQRRTPDGLEKLQCPSPDGCTFAAAGACKPFGRLYVTIGDVDPLSSFIFRTTGFNSIRTLAARLRYYQALSGNRLAYMPFDLRLRGKSTRQSHGSPIYFVDLTLREGCLIEEVIAEARTAEAAMHEAGVDQAKLEEVVRLGLANGAFEESEEDGRAVVEEFFTGDKELPESSVGGKTSTLAEKLQVKVVAGDSHQV